MSNQLTDEGRSVEERRLLLQADIDRVRIERRAAVEEADRWAQRSRDVCRERDALRAQLDRVVAAAAREWAMLHNWNAVARRHDVLWPELQHAHEELGLVLADLERIT